MTIELITVIEIGYNNLGVPVPNEYPCWDNPEIWNNYHNESYQKAGFKDKLVPYLNGSSFYRLSDITDNNLTKLIIDHTEGIREKIYEKEQACTLFGGYVLKVNGEDKYFPQCCGELSDIHYWERLSNGQSSHYEGHPEPIVYFKNDNIIFDFSVDDFDEIFEPTPPKTILTIDRFELKKAVESVRKELQDFEQRLNKINQEEKLNINNIGELLIWDNENYK